MPIKLLTRPRPSPPPQWPWPWDLWALASRIHRKWRWCADNFCWVMVRSTSLMMAAVRTVVIASWWSSLIDRAREGEITIATRHSQSPWIRPNQVQSNPFSPTLMSLYTTPDSCGPFSPHALHPAKHNRDMTMTHEGNVHRSWRQLRRDVIDVTSGHDIN